MIGVEIGGRPAWAQDSSNSVKDWGRKLGMTTVDCGGGGGGEGGGLKRVIRGGGGFDV